MEKDNYKALRIIFWLFSFVLMVIYIVLVSKSGLSHNYRSVIISGLAFAMKAEITILGIKENGRISGHHTFMMIAWFSVMLYTFLNV